MRIIRGLNRIPQFKNPVLCVGVFDGVHRGHTRLIMHAVRKAQHIQGISIVLTFWPHPRGKETIYSLEHRLNKIALCGVDVCVVLTLHPHLFKMSPEDFIKKIIVGKIHAKWIFVGKNFKFGQLARGNVQMLIRLGRVYGFKVQKFATCTSSGDIVSSTLIREAILNGNLRYAQLMLGRPVSILGEVGSGEQLGRKLGVPTANILPHHEVIPPSGIYAVKVLWREIEFGGVCYIGRKPTITHKGKSRVVIEVHIFNFKKNIYGHTLEILFIKKIRDEKKFVNLKELQIQMQKDIKSAHLLINRHHA